jgi:hypothetical protein
LNLTDRIPGAIDVVNASSFCFYFHTYFQFNFVAQIRWSDCLGKMKTSWDLGLGRAKTPQRHGNSGRDRACHSCTAFHPPVRAWDGSVTSRWWRTQGSRQWPPNNVATVLSTFSSMSNQSTPLDPVGNSSKMIQVSSRTEIR